VLSVRHGERRTWEFPGDGIEDAGSAEGAAMREVPLKIDRSGRLFGGSLSVLVPKRPQEPDPSRNCEDDADERHDRPIGRKIHQVILASQICASQISRRRTPPTLRYGQHHPPTVPLIDGTMTPARMEPTPRLFNERLRALGVDQRTCL
jgi:hypothetical protein